MIANTDWALDDWNAELRAMNRVMLDLGCKAPIAPDKKEVCAALKAANEELSR